MIIIVNYFLYILLLNLLFETYNLLFYNRMEVEDGRKKISRFYIACKATLLFEMVLRRIIKNMTMFCGFFARFFRGNGDCSRSMFAIWSCFLISFIVTDFNIHGIVVLWKYVGNDTFHSHVLGSSLGRIKTFFERKHQILGS